MKTNRRLPDEILSVDVPAIGNKSPNMKSKSGLRIEELCEANLPGATRLVVRLWPECIYEEELENGLRIIKAANQKGFVARAGTSFTGFIQLSLRTDYVEGTASSPVLYVEGLYVEPGWRRRGVARQLIAKAGEWGRQMGCTEMASDAELGNAGSIEFHKALGFTEVNRVVCFVRPLPE